MILVTGGTGLAGSAVVRELVARGRPVAVLTRNAASVAAKFPGLLVDAREGDVRDAASLRPAFDGVEAVIDCVQFPNSPIENTRKGWTFEDVDYKGTVNQTGAAKASGVQRYVYLSGAGASPDAAQHWFRYKWQAEEAVRRSGIPHVILRATWLYGPDDRALNRFLGFARTLQFVPLFGDGKQLMQPLFVEDLGRILADAVDRPEAADRTLDAGGPERMSMDDVIRTALDVAGVRRPIVHQPVALGKAIASVLRFLPGPPLTPDAIDFITNDTVADNHELERVLEPRLTPLREGLATYLGPGARA